MARSRLGIELISVFNLPPVDFVNLAADLNCPNISMILTPLDYNPQNYPAWDLLNDKKQQREMKAAMRDRDVRISLGEGYIVAPGTDVREVHGKTLDVMLELGVKLINTISFDPDENRTFDQFALVVEMAKKAGIDAVTEFAPCFASNRDLKSALRAVRHVNQPNFRVLLDTMHLIRGGGSAADVAKLAPDAIGYVQLCDAPLVPTNPDYLDEATYERKIPGEGELPLLDILAEVSPDLVISVEVPLRSLADKGIAPRERLTRCAQISHDLVARAEKKAAEKRAKVA